MFLAPKSNSEKKHAELSAVLMKQMSDGVITLDSKANIRYFNPVAERIFGYSQQEILDHPIAQLLEPPSSVNGDWGKICDQANRDVPLKALRKDGSSFIAQIQINAVNHVYGDLSFVILIRYFDEEQKQFSLLKAMQRISQIGAWEYDRLSQQIKCTEGIYQIFQFPQGAIIDVSNALNMFNQEQQVIIVQHITEAIEAKKHWDFETYFHTAQQQQVWLRYRGQAEYRGGEPNKIYGTIENISKEKNLELKLQENNVNLTAIVQNSSDLIAAADRNLNILLFNQAFADDMLQIYAIKVKPGDNLFDLLLPGSSDQDKIRNDWRRALKGESFSTEIHLGATKMHQQFYEFTLSPIRNKAGEVSGVAQIGRNITDRKIAEDKLSFLATHDPLTGLHNRREFESRLHRLLQSAKRYGTKHALLYMDLDQFKIINDTCGHGAGDEMLRQLALVLCKRIRQRDTIARLGGDEFGVLLEHCDAKNALEVAKQMLQTVQDFSFYWDDKKFTLGISIGLIPIDKNCESMDRILAYADSLCYSAKAEGRNRIHIFDRQEKEFLRRQNELQWVTQINQAIADNRLILMSQEITPISGSEEGRHYEILVRMQAEDYSIILPGHFLPAAENFNLMPSIDREVVEKTFRWLADNPKEQEALAHCAINISGHTLGDAGFYEFIINRFQHYGVKPKKITFEITESMAVLNLEKTLAFINQLREYGFCFSLDDFGSGFSSYMYLKKMPIDYLKIDGIFVKDMLTDPIDEVMVESINEIGHTMGKKTIAEYVESEDILQRLREIGVDYAQGFAIAKPKPLDQ